MNKLQLLFVESVFVEVGQQSIYAVSMVHIQNFQL